MKNRLKFLLVSILAMLMIGVASSVQAAPDRLYLSAVDDFGAPTIIDPTIPICTDWHCVAVEPGTDPSFICNTYHLDDWQDSDGSGDLTPSDQILLGALGWCHVDEVLTTIHWTEKAAQGEPPVGEEGIAEGDLPITTSLPDPHGSVWHQIYPPEKYCKIFTITSWEDSDGSTDFNPSDQFDFEYEEAPGVKIWAHLDAISTDIKVSTKDPWQVPEFPLGLGVALGLGLTVAVVYVVWKRRPKISPA